MLIITIALLLSVYLGLSYSFQMTWSLVCILCILLWVRNLSERVLIIICFIVGYVSAQSYFDNRTKLIHHPHINGRVVKHFDRYAVLGDVHVDGRSFPFKIAVVSQRNFEINQVCSIASYKLRFHQRSLPENKVPRYFKRKVVATVLSNSINCVDGAGVLDNVRNTVMSVVENYIHQGVMRALLLGDTSSMLDDDKMAFRQSGTAHLMAVSGLHLGVLSGFNMYASKKLLLFFKVRPLNCLKGGYVWTLIVLWCYASLTGWSFSTYRSYSMVFLGSVIGLMAMSAKKESVFYGAVMVLLISDPWCVMDIGFWLSIIAVQCLLGLGRSNYKLGALYQSMKLCLYMAPITSQLSGVISVHSIIVNTMLVPLYSIVIFPGLLLWIVFSLGMDLTAVGVVLDRLIDVSIMFMQWANRYGLFINVDEFSLLHIVCMQGAIVVYECDKRQCLMWILLCLFLSLVNIYSKSIQYGQAKITMLDVGHGLSMAVQTKNHALLYDLGPKFGKTSLGDHVVKSLRNLGVRKLDGWVLSHPDQDHIGGLKEVHKAYKPKWILAGVPKDTPVASSQCMAGQSWQWDGVKFSILHPNKSWKKRNNNSCVLWIQSSKQSALLTGDIEFKAEKSMINDLKKVTLLQVPHHGSLTSSSLAFLKKVNPGAAWISVGEGNAAIPHKKVLNRYNSLNITTHQTSKEGWLTMTLN
jgi:competence protein ComEC